MKMLLRSSCKQHQRRRSCVYLLLYPVLMVAATIGIASDGAAATDEPVIEEVWGLSLPIPMPAYVVRPPGTAPYPLVVMNHGESLDATARGFFPQAEFRDAMLWFARKGFLVVAPIRPGFGATAINFPELAFRPIYFGEIGDCAQANFRDPGLAIAAIDRWTIDYLVRQGVARPKAIVVGQSGGGWGAVALSREDPNNVRAIIAFAAGRGGRIGGKPNNNCAPEKLVETAGEFGRSAKIPVLWIYTNNDSYFGPALSRRLFAAFRTAGGAGEYHLLPDFGEDGHFLVDSPDAIPIWSPLVSRFLEFDR